MRSTLAPLLVAPLAMAAQIEEAPPCPHQLDAATDALDCACSAQAAQNGNLWGTDVYTADSALCPAALHAGVIDFPGGRISVRAAPGRNAYPGSDRNGLQSAPFGRYERSIAFLYDGERHNHIALAACPGNAAALAPGASLACLCSWSASGEAAGTVWGTGPYTADSALCRAAVHAGRIGPGGGVIRARALPGRAAYPAGEANGVTAEPWPAMDKSVGFEPVD